jgi:hypothetical protein
VFTIFFLVSSANPAKSVRQGAKISVNFKGIGAVGKPADDRYLEAGKDFIRRKGAKILSIRMPDQKEVQRLLGFAREHARAALAKPQVQRESYLAFCKLNFKRYAAGISRSAAEAERFASALDRATRDMMVEMQDPEAAQQVELRSPWYPLRDDAVEGALDSVTVYEAAIEPAPPPPPPPAEQSPLDPKTALIMAEELYRQDHERLHVPVEAPIEHQEAVAAADEDRQAAKFGFGGLERPQALQSVPVPEADPELKRKVREMLRARAAAAGKTDEES